MKVKWLEELKPVAVLWVDSSGYSGWQDEIPLANLHCVSVGMLLENGEEAITLALNTSDQQIGDLMIIPKCAVKEIIELRSKCRISTK